MSQTRFQSNQGRFRETLKHEDHIHNQIDACRQAFNMGNPTEIMYSVESLLLLITPAMEDEKFLAEMLELKEEWHAKKLELEEVYRKRLKAAIGCPDIVRRPSMKPPVEHFKKMFMIACALFERKNLMLKVSTDEEI